MAISYSKLASEIFKVLKNIPNKSIVMYDNKGGGPIASPENAKWIMVKPDNILIRLPQGYSTESDEISIYRSTNDGKVDFKSVLNRIKKVTKLYQIGISISNFEQDNVAQEFANVVKRDMEELEEAIPPAKTKVLLEFRQLLQFFTKVK